MGCGLPRNLLLPELVTTFDCALKLSRSAINLATRGILMGLQLLTQLAQLVFIPTRGVEGGRMGGFRREFVREAVLRFSHTVATRS